MEQFIKLSGTTLPRLNMPFLAKYPEGICELVMVKKDDEIIFTTVLGTEMNAPTYWKKKD